MDAITESLAQQLAAMKDERDHYETLAGTMFGKRKEAQEQLAAMTGERDHQKALADDYRARNARLVVALKPFATFAEKFDAKPISAIHDEIYSIHSGIPELESGLYLSDCRKARAALAKSQPK